MFCAIVLTAVMAPPHALGEIEQYYKIENIETPKDVPAEVDGVAMMPDGRIAVCFHRDGVWMYDPAKKTWKQFAEGLHEPLGIVAINDHEVVVMQRPELTRLRDTDGDNVADQYITVTDDFGMTGNYHEFAFGPVMDKDGNFYISLNTASNGAGVRYEVRGATAPNGRAGRMYSYVPWRGWVMKVTPEGKIEPFALGFRSPNGLGFDMEGNLFVTDNQGDWIGTSPLYHVMKDHFYGHVASLVWKSGFEGDPLKTPVKELDAMRTKAAVLFPHGVMANSPTQPLCDTTGGKFGPFAGQMFVGEMNRARLMRVMLENVGGELQGASVVFYDNAGLSAGVSRMCFDAAGAMYVGHTKRVRGWSGGTGLQKLTWTGVVPPEVQAMHLTKDGFTLTFTRPLNSEQASNASNYKFRRYYYEYHQQYGSNQFGMHAVPVTAAKVSADGRTVSLTLSELMPGYIHELTLANLTTADEAHPIVNRTLYYALNRLVDEGAGPVDGGK
ncbi:MAG: hypothetical protein GC162_08625 [Planctomycetes bacterium]|nr:hypothetical protein [Planctomycetota bacterium]